MQIFVGLIGFRLASYRGVCGSGLVVERRIFDPFLRIFWVDFVPS